MGGEVERDTNENVLSNPDAEDYGWQIFYREHTHARTHTKEKYSIQVAWPFCKQLISVGELLGYGQNINTGVYDKDRRLQRNELITGAESRASLPVFHQILALTVSLWSHQNTSSFSHRVLTSSFHRMSSFLPTGLCVTCFMTIYME